MTRLLPPITGNRRGIYGGGAKQLFFSFSFSFSLAGKVDVSVQDWNVRIQYQNTYFIIFPRSPPSSGGCTWSATNLNLGFFFSRGPLDSTQFRPEAPQKCSQRLFNHSAQIIQRVSPQVSLCPYVRDFLSLCVLYSAAFPWDFLRTFQTGAHLDAAGRVSAHCDAVWCAMAGQSVSLIWRLIWWVF